MSKRKNKTEQNITDDPMSNSDISNEPVSQETGADAEINSTADGDPASIAGRGEPAGTDRFITKGTWKGQRTPAACLSRLSKLCSSLPSECDECP